jgi:hypothetical protein
MAQNFLHQLEHTLSLRRRNRPSSRHTLRHVQLASCQHSRVGAGCSAGIQVVKGNSIRALDLRHFMLTYWSFDAWRGRRVGD